MHKLLYISCNTNRNAQLTNCNIPTFSVHHIAVPVRPWAEVHGVAGHILQQLSHLTPVSRGSAAIVFDTY